MLYEQWVIPCTYIGEDMPPGPTPETAGLKKGFAYLVVATVEQCDVEKGEIWYNIINHKGQTWSLSNRHFRTVQIGVPGQSRVDTWLVPVENLETNLSGGLESVECL